MGKGNNAEALRRRRNAKRKGGAGHEFHERARIRKIGAVTGQRLTDGFMEIAQNYGLTPSWTDSFTNGHEYTRIGKELNAESPRCWRCAEKFGDNRVRMRNSTITLPP